MQVIKDSVADARARSREQTIREAATRLFAAEGFHAVSTRRIAAEAGVSEGTIFHYFGAKQALMLDILERFYRETLEASAAAIVDREMDSLTRLLQLGVNHVLALAADNGLMMRLIQVYLSVDVTIARETEQSPLRAMNRSYVRYVDRTLKEAAERGELRADFDLRATRDIYFGALEYGLRTRQHHANADDDPTAWVEALVLPLWRGISRAEPPTAAPAPDRLGDLCERLESVATRLEQQADRPADHRQKKAPTKRGASRG
jgi:TetR/AcrR family fatty acid metabolism transcriptional regulator